MKPKHLFSSDHGDDGNTLFPHHLPEVLTRVRQGTLRGNVAPLLPTCCYLMRQTSHQSQDLISNSWQTTAVRTVTCSQSSRLESEKA